MGKKETPAEEPESKTGCLGKLAALVALAGLVGLGAALWFIATPQDLTDLDGRAPAAADESPRDLKEVLRRSIERGFEATITEKELNLYLRDTLEATQGGLLAGQVTLEDVAVRLEDGRAEIITVRDVAGYPLTLSMYLRVEQFERPDGELVTEVFRNGGPYHEKLPRPSIGGRFGKLPVPEGFLHLVMPAFESLAAVYRDAEADSPEKEIDFIESMARVRIEEGKLVLDPVPNTRTIPAPGP